MSVLCLAGRFGWTCRDPLHPIALPPAGIYQRLGSSSGALYACASASACFADCAHLARLEGAGQVPWLLLAPLRSAVRFISAGVWRVVCEFARVCFVGMAYARW
jgi:hypothetical protein